MKIIDKLDKMQRDKTHIFRVKNGYIKEEIVLNKRFSNKIQYFCLTNIFYYDKIITV